MALTHYQREALKQFPGRLLAEGRDGAFAVATSSAIFLFPTEAQAVAWRQENCPGAAGWRLKPPPQRQPIEYGPPLCALLDED